VNNVRPGMRTPRIAALVQPPVEGLHVTSVERSRLDSPFLTKLVRESIVVSQSSCLFAERRICLFLLRSNVCGRIDGDKNHIVVADRGAVRD